MSRIGPCSDPERCEGGRHEAAMRDAKELLCALLPHLQRKADRLAVRWLAEDAVQEACERLLLRAEAFIRHPNPRAYAIRTVATTLIDQQRRRRREVLAADVPEGPSQGASDSVEARWETERLLRSLPSGQSAAVRLVDVEGYTIDQAAKILGVHRGTVSRARLRGLAVLRKISIEEESYGALA
ncbi:RNA polymerase sigma factor [Streptomyces sp. G44]|nr:RNA polymerase sigma factor [Streptomyces sp. G44]